MKIFLAFFFMLFATALNAETVRIIESNPVYYEGAEETVQCRTVRVPSYSTRAGDPLEGMLLGGIAGKVIGGDDRDAIAGAILGGILSGGDRTVVDGYYLKQECPLVTQRVLMISHYETIYSRHGKYYKLETSREYRRGDKVNLHRLQHH